MPKLERHVFVCGNEREPGHPRGCCAAKDANALKEAFKTELAKHGLKGRVRINHAGCLDQCEHGPVIVVYPDTVWYGSVQPGDVAEIVERHLLGGEAVRRLMIADDCLNNPKCPHRAKPGGTA